MSILALVSSLLVLLILAVQMQTRKLKEEVRELKQQIENLTKRPIG